jgi:hypothetical protein
MTVKYFTDQRRQRPPPDSYDDHDNTSNEYLPNLIIIMGSVIAADIGSTWLFSESSSGFVRNLEVSPAVRFFFSLVQILATSGCLCLSHQRYSMHFIFCFIIQLNAFLMTLRRKNLAGHYTLITIYGTMLLGGWIIGDGETAQLSLEARYQMYIVGLTAAFLRLFPRHVLQFYPWSHVVHSKYFIWPMCYVLLQYVFPHLAQQERNQTEQSLLLYYGVIPCHVAVALLAIYKITISKSTITIRSRVSKKQLSK